MVMALKAGAMPALLTYDLGAAMPTDVGEGAHDAIRAACDDDGHLADGAGEEIARRLHSFGQTDELPGAAKDARGFALVDRRVGIPRRGQCLTSFERLPQV